MNNTEARARVAIQTVLYATDFSDGSEAALPYALAFTRGYGAMLHIAHVIVPEQHDFQLPEWRRQIRSAGSFPNSAAFGDTCRECERTRRAVSAGELEQMRSSASDQVARLRSGTLRDVVHRVWLTEGVVWSQLSEVIRKEIIDLVVLGTQGTSSKGQLLLGSTAENAFRRAPCLVLTVGPSARTYSDEYSDEPRFERILCAVDFGAAAQIATEYAVSVARQRGAELMLLHVTDPASFAAPDRKEIATSYYAQLERLVRPDAAISHRPNFKVAAGNAAENILQHAYNFRADLIVLGARQGVAMSNALLCSTGYRVVCEAHCPVLTVPA